MECNKDEALRAKEIAESKFMARDIAGARKFAMKAQNLFPLLEGINQMIATFDVYLASEGKVFDEMNWYAVLCLNPSADEDTIKKQYRKFALQLHPDKNKSIGAEGAFKLISEAWNTLSDKSRRMIYDQKINAKRSGNRNSLGKDNYVPTTSTGFHRYTKSVASKVQTAKNYSHAAPATVHQYSNPSKTSTFWTSCNHCKMQYEYARLYLNHKLLCPNCHEPFLAAETALPTNGCRFSWSGSQQRHNNSSKNSNYSCGVGKNNPSFSGRMAAVFQHGKNQGSYNNHNFKWGAFSRAAGAASASASSTSAAQAANIVHRTYEKVRREREEAQAAARTAEAFHKKKAASKRKVSASAIHHAAASGDNSPTKKRRGIHGDVNNNDRVFTRHAGSSGLGFHGGPVDLPQYRMGATENQFRRAINHLDIQDMLIKRARFAIHSKLEQWDAQTAKVEEKENARKPSEDDKERRKDRVRNHSADHAAHESRNCAAQYVSMKNSLNENSDSSDDDISLPISIDVPDSDFHNFDNDRSEKSFESDQVWATYDDEDGMPRYYVLIQKVFSFNPLKVRMSFLTAKSNSEFGSLNWTASGFAKTCGDFRVGRYEVNETINIFSHKVRWEKGVHGVIKIVPRKGEIWALYRNWSPQWNEHTPDDIIYKYDMVEVLDDYSEEFGITVIPLMKMAGFRSVYCHLIPKSIKKIQKEEMFCFSHQVPSYFLTGEEAVGAPKGCHELDPAATPVEFLQGDYRQEKGCST